MIASVEIINDVSVMLSGAEAFYSLLLDVSCAHCGRSYNLMQL